VYKVLQPTAVQVTVVSALAEPGVAKLVWYLAGAGSIVQVERQAPLAEWSSVAKVGLDENGFARFEDRQVEAGARYGYRLRLLGEAGEPAVGEAWVRIPEATLAIHDIVSDAAGRALTLAFSLPGREPARVEVFSVDGRRVLRQELGSPGPGEHKSEIAGSERLPRGLYVFRLTQQGHSVAAKRSILR